METSEAKTENGDKKERKYLTRKQLQKKLGISAATLSRWSKERCGPPEVKMPGKRGIVRYPADLLEEFLAEHTRYAKPE